MEQLRVLHMIPDFCVGGAERMALHLMCGLKRAGFAVGAISMYDRRGTDIERQLERAGVDVRYLGKRPGVDIRMYGRIHRVIREFRPDVVHTHRYILRYAWPSLLLRGVPVSVHTVHNPVEQDALPRWGWVDRLAYRTAVVPVAISRDVVRSLDHMHGVTGVPLIPNGIPTEIYANARGSREQWRAREGFAASDVLVVTVGRLVWQKNHASLLRAFATAARDNADTKLVIAGDGPLRDSLLQHANELGVADRTRLLGTRTDVPELLAASDIFALSSLTEGHPLSLLEAMAAGRASVATAVGGVGEILDESTGIVIPADDADALTAALQRLLADRGLRQRMGDRASEVAHRGFDCELMVRQYANLYGELLERRMCCSTPLVQEAALRDGIE